MNVVATVGQMDQLAGLVTTQSQLITQVCGKYEIYGMNFSLESTKLSSQVLTELRATNHPPPPQQQQEEA